MKNSMLCLVLSVFFVSQLFLTAAFSQDTVVRVVPDSVRSPRVGQQFTVDIAIENGRNVAGYQVMLHFDRYSLKHVETQPGNYLPANAFFGNTKFIGSHGTVLFAATASPQERSGDGILATLTFEIMEVKPSNFRFSVADPSRPRRGTILSNKDVELSFPRLEGAEIFQGLGTYDLVVDSPRVSDATLSPGAEFTLSVTIRNRGGGVTPLISLYYYRSSNDTISMRTDTEVGFEFLSSLGANKSDTESITLIAPMTPGTYYYGACAGIMHDEANQGNNCSDAVKITVSQSQPERVPTGLEGLGEVLPPEVIEIIGGTPGLVVQSMSVSKSTVSPGERFTLTAIVANQGTAESGPTTLRFYRSENAIITTGDTRLETVSVSGLGLPLGGRSKSTERITLTAPTSPGIYYYGACVDREEGEPDCSDAVKVTVRGAPDLAIESVRADPPTVAPGEKFKLYATLKNQGTGHSSSTTLRYYRSDNPIISPSDTQIGRGNRNPLAPNGTITKYFKVTAPTTPGTYYYGVCVDEVDSESNTGNNCHIDAVPVTVKSPTLTLPPDFISDVAYGGNTTYFVLTAEFLTPDVANKADLVYKDCTITLDIPGVPDKTVGLFDKKNPRLDNPGYFVIPLLTPREMVTEVDDAILAGAITELPFTSVILGLVEGTSIINQALQATADPTIILPSSKHRRGRPQGKNRYLVLITQQITHIRMRVEQKYNLLPSDKAVVGNADPTYTAVYSGTWDLEKTWKQENGISAAPSAHPMSLSDYPPFQMLSPEMQEYLLQHLGEFVNAEAWQIPEEPALLANYPNPFNPETWIPYQLSKASDVALTIYDIHGRDVRTLDLGHQRAGIYQDKSRAAYWDGRNAHGEPVASGVYFYTLTAGDFSATRKMLIRK